MSLNPSFPLVMHYSNHAQFSLIQPIHTSVFIHNVSQTHNSIRSISQKIAHQTTSSSPPTRPPLIKYEKLDLPPPPLDFSKGWGRIQMVVAKLLIPEDSIFRKLAACIPVIGVIPTVLNNHSLRNKITAAKDPIDIGKLIDVRNDYKICSIVRLLLSLAMIASSVALNILTGTVAIAALTGGSVIAASGILVFLHGMYKNEQVIHALRTGHFPNTVYIR